MADASVGADAMAPQDAGAVLDAADAQPASNTEAGDADAAPDYAWQLPPGFPVPAVPANNPMSAEKVTLGRHLFYDVQLSNNQTQSCSSCHQQALAFTDGRAQAIGSTGMQHPRGAMSLANVAYASTLTWANPLELDLEHQALVPMFGDDPISSGSRAATSSNSGSPPTRAIRHSSPRLGRRTRRRSRPITSSRRSRASSAR